MEGVYFTREVTLAVPNKGRMKRPSLRLLKDTDLKAIEKCAWYSGCLGLIEWSQSPSMPLNLRKAAGLKAVERCCYIDDLTDWSKDKGLPESVRKAAADSVEAMCMRTIELRTEYGNYEALSGLSKDPNVSHSVRKAAADSVEAAGMTAVKMRTESGQWRDLIKMSKDERLPESVRKAAAGAGEPLAMKVVETYAEKEGIPPSVLVALYKVAKERAAKGVANPIAGDGVLSEGKVRPPAAKDGCG